MLAKQVETALKW
jgi:hypothetical protein